MSPQPTTEELRSVIIGILDKLNQVEAILIQHQHLGSVQEALAEVRAYRVTSRGFLARLRMLEEQSEELPS